MESFEFKNPYFTATPCILRLSDRWHYYLLGLRPLELSLNQSGSMLVSASIATFSSFSWTICISWAFLQARHSPLVPKTKSLTLFAVFSSWAWHFVYVAICVGFISHPDSTTVTSRDIAHRAELLGAMMLGACATFPHAFFTELYLIILVRLVGKYV